MLATTAGWVGEVEVVEVEFDPRAVSYEMLLAHAIDRDCAVRVFTRSDEHQALASAAVAERAVRTEDPIRVVEDQKYYLSRTPLRYVPMTATQATRINADVKDAERWLSPRQWALRNAANLDRRGRPVLIDVPLTEAWDAAQGR